MPLLYIMMFVIVFNNFCIQHHPGRAGTFFQTIFLLHRYNFAVTSSSASSYAELWTVVLLCIRRGAAGHQGLGQLGGVSWPRREEWRGEWGGGGQEQAGGAHPPALQPLVIQSYPLPLILVHHYMPQTLQPIIHYHLLASICHPQKSN